MKTMEYNITTADGETHKGGITIKRGHSFTNVKIINNIKEIVGQEFIDVFDVDNQCEIKKCYGKDITTNNFMVIVKEDDGKLKAGMFLVGNMYRRVIHIKRVTDKYAIYDQWRRPYDTHFERGLGLIREYSNRKRLIRENGGFEFINSGGIIFYNINYLIKEGAITDSDDRRRYDKIVNDIKGKKVPYSYYEYDNVDRVEDNHMFEA
tara:strand:- start:748 stop:1368 length:621 start_codon:yes stop_codon:yes gene_type:complete